jgi:hypothetical protein
VKFGRSEQSTPTTAESLAARRIEAARHCRAWTELNPDVLVQRERRYYVNAETDETFEVYRGDAFSPAGDGVADMTPLAFIVRDGDVIVLERLPHTWSEIVYQRARAGTR